MKKRKSFFNWRKLLSKRQQFGLLTFCATIGLVATQLVSNVDYYLPVATILAVVVALGGLFIFRPDIAGVRVFTAVILLASYTWAVALFYFLLPVRWLTRLPMAILFSIGFYAILLTENIYNVATGRTIQLLRAARSIGLLMTLITIFLLFETIISLHLSVWYNFLLFFAVSFPLVFQSLWSMELKLSLNQQTLVYSLILSVCLSEIGGVLSFWPGKGTLQALFLTTFYYVIVGVTQQAMIDRLFSQTVREYIVVTLVVFFLFFLTTSWSG